MTADPLRVELAELLEHVGTRPGHTQQIHADTIRALLVQYPEQPATAECTCYPGGFIFETYEGPQVWCDVHGQPSAAWDQGMANGMQQIRDLCRAGLCEHANQQQNETITYLQNRRREVLRVLRQCTDANADYWRWQGHAELARQLLTRLGAEVPQ